jgi:site-specific DNA recombinase
VGRLPHPPDNLTGAPCRPTHEPLVTKTIFDAATPISRLRQGSRGGAGPNTAHRQAQRSYLLRSYLVCDLRNRRMFGKARIRGGVETIYYACITNPEHHQAQPWYGQHAKNITVRQDHLLPVVGKFFGERILGPQRGLYLEHREPRSDHDDGEVAQRAALRKQLDQLGRAQINLMKQLEVYEPSGDDIDTEWRAALQRRFAQIATERRSLDSRLARLTTEDADRGCGDAALLDLLPQGAIDPTLLSEEEQRDLYDAFHLQLRYDRPTHQVTLRVTIYADAVGVLIDKIHSLRNGEPPKRVDGDEMAVAAGAAVTAARSLGVGAPGGIQPKLLHRRAAANSR